MFGLKPPHFYLAGMNHESNKSPSSGMISTATRTTATVSPLSPLTNGNAVAQSTNSGFAAALRKLAKQAEDPRGSALSGESSPVSSPPTSHSSPVTTPKRGSLGPLPGPTRGHGVPSTPPVVTIAPTKTSNGLWRSDGRQVEPGVQGLRERSGAENTQPQLDKRTPPVPSPRTLTHPFGLTSTSVMQDPRIQSLNLPGQMHPVVPSGAIPEEYLRALRPFATADDLRLTSLPLSLDPTAAHAAATAAYYHPAYLHYPLSLQRMEESLCLSALRSQFYSVPAGGAFPPLHPSALHLHLPGGRYPGELNHTALAERLQMENELRQREREQEREREKEREREARLEREREREEERERELDRQKERQRERQQQMVRAVESHYLAELQARRAPPEDRARPGERLTPNRLDKAKDSELPGFQAPKPLPLQPGLHSFRGSVPHPVPSLVPSHLGKHHASAGGIHGALAATVMPQRSSEEAWLARQRGQGQGRESPLELGLRSPGKGGESRRDSHRTNPVHHTSSSKDVHHSFGAPPPLISPKGPHHPPAPPTTLWNPVSLVDPPGDSHRKFNPSTPPSRPPPGLTRADRPPQSWGEKLEEGSRRRAEGSERYAPARAAGLAEPWSRPELERAAPHSLHHRHHVNSFAQKPCAPLSVPGTAADPGARRQASPPPPARERPSQAADSMLVYDEVLQQHRRLLSKLDLEEKRKREAREGGYYYDLDESYDESDEEEVKAHLRRVSEQPPLKLDTSSEKVDFLRLCGLTTAAHRDELLVQKRRKRRRMMRERSPSPAATRGKRKAPSPTPTAPLSTPYSAEQMDSAPELEEKKGFLHMFHLSHVSPQQRRNKRRTEELLKAIQRKTVTLDTLRYNALPPCKSPPAPSAGDSSSGPLLCQSNGHLYPDSPSPSPPYLHKPKHPPSDTFKPYVDAPLPRVPPPLAPHPEKADLMEVQPNRKLQNGVVAAPPQEKDPGPVQNGRNRPWERFTPEAFAQHFHQAVLQSTHGTLQSRGVSGVPEPGMKTGHSLPHNLSQPKSSNLSHAPQGAYVNGHRLSSSGAGQDPAAAPLQEGVSEEDEDASCQEEEDDEETEEAPRKWRGIEAVFEAYHEYVDEWSVERQVLHTQCKRLEAQNYNLTRTAEQLSLTMGELVSQRQKVREERERLQAQLEHFRRCLTLPTIHWGRGPVNGHTLR
ncbi:genetic suppressor element 1-like isoform X2 [Betta splendens]|uniref:Genetic suppressor element 1-like isoform X2 n=1 Tax=Betta splendens TaxID=158456 RepID=A0A6P7MTZ0_BETSP|nr:genetic suppressor element 1-like isoform X2 [Betta splendens]